MAAFHWFCSGGSDFGKNAGEKFVKTGKSVAGFRKSVYNETMDLRDMSVPWKFAVRVWNRVIHGICQAAAVSGGWV